VSYSILVLCKESKSVPRREIAQFIEDGVYFDEVSFSPITTPVHFGHALHLFFLGLLAIVMGVIQMIHPFFILDSMDCFCSSR
jgi:hypothetical protein